MNQSEIWTASATTLLKRQDEIPAQAIFTCLNEALSDHGKAWYVAFCPHCEAMAIARELKRRGA
jgi:hypothetical protein